MKYHIWKLGVVFTDNVSMASRNTDSVPGVQGCHSMPQGSKRGKTPREVPGILQSQRERCWGHVSLVQSCKTDGVSLGNS